jgi:hypothetical protein
MIVARSVANAVGTLRGGTSDRHLCVYSVGLAAIASALLPLPLALAGQSVDASQAYVDAGAEAEVEAGAVVIGGQCLRLLRELLLTPQSTSTAATVASIGGGDDGKFKYKDWFLLDLLCFMAVELQLVFSFSFSPQDALPLPLPLEEEEEEEEVEVGARVQSGPRRRLGELWERAKGTAACGAAAVWGAADTATDTTPIGTGDSLIINFGASLRRIRVCSDATVPGTVPLLDYIASLRSSLVHKR